MLLVSALGNFYRYEKLTLSLAGPFHLHSIEYEQRARTASWDKLIAEDVDPYVREVYKDRDKMMVGIGLYNFCNLPIHFFYSVFHLRGVHLWLAQKFLMVLCGIIAACCMFLLGSLFYGPLVGFLSACLFIFSPHIWLTYHIDANIDRSYNLMLSLWTVYFFFLYQKRNKRLFLIFSGVAMGLNYLFFNIGSLMMPLILFLFSIYQSIVAKSAKSFMSFLAVFLISIFSAIFFSFLHQCYLRIPVNPLLTWVTTYLSWGPTASHSSQGMVFLRPHDFILNVKNHIFGVFVNGKTADWHYMTSPPGVPMVYNYLIAVFFLLACYLTLFKRKWKGMFFFIWFLIFFAVYCLIFMRPKNIIWEMVPIFILSSRAVVFFSVYLSKLIKQVSKRVMCTAFVGIFALSSAGAGSYFIFSFLPKKNFYNPSYIGTYQMFGTLEKAGLTASSKIIFSSSQLIVGNMMMRLFFDRAPEIICLNHRGVTNPPDPQVWIDLERRLLEKADNIFYCFLYYQNYGGDVYATDETYRETFGKIHPDIPPVPINGLDGKPIWRIYRVDKASFAKHIPWPISKSELIASSPLSASSPPQKTTSPVIENISPVADRSSSEATSKDEDFADKIIGSTFKLLAKSFVAVVNIAELKKYNIKKINKMDDEKFRKHYRNAYLIIKDLPEWIKTQYGVAENMSREQAIQNTASLNKKDIYKILDAIPNRFIADKFRIYLRETKEEIEGANLVVQIKQFWSRAVDGAKSTTKPAITK